MRIRAFTVNMGRTIPSFRMAIDIEIAKWKPFRDALRKPDKEIFVNMLLRSKPNSDNPDVFPCRVEGCSCKDFLEVEVYE